MSRNMCNVFRGGGLQRNVHLTFIVSNIDIMLRMSRQGIILYALLVFPNSSGSLAAGNWNRFNHFATEERT